MTQRRSERIIKSSDALPRCRGAFSFVRTNASNSNTNMVTVYRSRIKDKHTGRWRVLRWMMTEADAIAWARKEDVKIECIEGSAEARTDVDGRH